jgi:hypothetical protein
MGTVCDVATGQCQCAPGVTGVRCDTCVANYLRIPTLGCRHCDGCVHVLVHDVDTMTTALMAASVQLTNVSRAAMTAGRLRRMRAQQEHMRVGGDTCTTVD